MYLAESYKKVLSKIIRDGCCWTSRIVGYDDEFNPIYKWHHTFDKKIVTARKEELRQEINRYA